MTTTSAKDGSFSFAKVPYGKWIVREIEQPKGFVLDEKAYEVNISKAEQVVEIEIVNEYVHGNIILTKVDAEYPDNKLTGATFEVYKDTNENGKIDDGDELIGNLEETETGIYEMKELLYGKYIVRETKAPEGFLLDKGEYSVFIEKDETSIIDVNHTLVYYDHRTEGSKKGCYFNVNTTKTPAGMRQVPMLEFVKEAFLMEKERQELLGLHCEATVDGYTDFIFVNRFGQPQHQATLNKAIRRIIRNCNDKQFLESENPEVLLPHFSCHSLRHTFTTRMCEAGVNVKVIQDALGHKDVSTTLNIYTDVTKELRKSEFEGLELQFNQ